MKNIDYRKIINTVYNAYAKGGQSAAFELANEYGCNYEYCKACECDSPQISHTCLICGQETTAVKKQTEQPPAPIKEDAKHTPGEWEWKQSRGNNFFEHIVYSGITVIAELGKTAIGNKEEIPEIKANAALIALCPTLLKENEQLKRDVKMLREAAKNFMYNWEALGNANDYSHTATRIAEALSQTETN